MTALADLPLLASGKVREIYDLGDDAAARRLGPDLDLRRRPPDADPRQGQRAHRPVGVLVRAHRRHRPQPPDLGHRRRARRGARPRRWWSASWRCCPSSASCAATSAARAGRTTSRPAPCRGIELPRRPARVRPAARADLHARRTKADVGHDEAIDFEGAVELIGDRALAERVRDVSIAVYEHAAEHARAARDHPRRHEVRVRPRRRRRADARRRGLHARTPRASGPPTSTSPAAASRASTSSSSATGPPRPAGTATPPAPAIPDDVVARTREKYVEAYERITGEPFDDWLRADRRADALMRARVLVRPKAGILDPQGQAVERALPALGFNGVQQRPRRAADRARRRGPGAAARDVRAAAGQPADRGLRDRRATARR